MWSVAVTTSGNEMGLSRAQVQALDPDELALRQRAIGKRLEGLGAHFIIEDIRGLPPVIEEINQLLQEGVRPEDYPASSRNFRNRFETVSRTKPDTCLP
jgi:phosphonoacetaldehyde hydrolase